MEMNVDDARNSDRLSTDVLLATGTSRQQLRQASADELLSLQTQLLMGDRWGMWEVSPRLIASTTSRNASCVVRLDLVTPEGIDPDSEIARRIWCELLRIAIALRLWPGAGGKRSKYSTIHLTIRSLGRVTRSIGGLDLPGFWSRTSRERIYDLLGKSGATFCNLLSRLHHEGVLADAPVSRARPRGNQAARDRTGEPEHSSPVESDTQWQAFPDAFTGEAGWHAIQLQQLVGQTLLDALEAATEVRVRTIVEDSRSARLEMPASKSHQTKIRADTRDPIIAQWQWRTPDGADISTLPFTILLRSPGGGEFSWPPRTYNQAWSMLPLLQACHLWPIALALGGRHGEILSLEQGCLRRETSHTPTAAMHTWKLDGVSGRDHESPLPELVVSAIHQQERLSRLVKGVSGIEGDHLWVTIMKWSGLPLTDFRPALKTFVRAFDLSKYLDGTAIHMHRFRKTLVRIVALALVHAPKILMDVLGHRDEQMTVMRYILSDPGLLNEIQETVRELIVLKGVEAVLERDRIQGKAAPVLRERVSDYAKRVGPKAMEPQNLMEFVRAMTEGGTGWAIIAPGIICTSFTRGGMCNKGQGGANPHYCNPACDNQLVMNEFDKDGITITSAVTQSIETLDYVLEKLRDADESGEDMLIAQFAGQVKALLGRWREVDQHFADHPTLRKHFPNVVLLP